jgi:hypothetical protein
VDKLETPTYQKTTEIPQKRGKKRKVNGKQNMDKEEV